MSPGSGPHHRSASGEGDACVNLHPVGARADSGEESPGSGQNLEVAVVIPCYRERRSVLGVLSQIGSSCSRIYVVDDGCPEGTGELVESECEDPRVRVLKLEENQGVGGATIHGYRVALEEGAHVIVRLDGDGQMDPSLIPRLVSPIAAGEADYVKGNRFFHLEALSPMPPLRRFGNTLLSFASKVSSGYWNIFDPTNGFTAIHALVVREVPLSRVSRGWFFESDMLFHLGVIRAVVLDLPMRASYGDEESSLRVRRVIGEFAWKHLRNGVNRLFLNYYLRDFNFASIELALGLALLIFGTVFGIVRWAQGAFTGMPATSGTVMLAALPVILGMEFLLAFVNHDLSSVPRDVLHRRLAPPE